MFPKASEAELSRRRVLLVNNKFLMTRLVESGLTHCLLASEHSPRTWYPHNMGRWDTNGPSKTNNLNADAVRDSKVIVVGDKVGRQIPLCSTHGACLADSSLAALSRWVVSHRSAPMWSRPSSSPPMTQAASLPPGPSAGSSSCRCPRSLPGPTLPSGRLRSPKLFTRSRSSRRRPTLRAGC